MSRYITAGEMRTILQLPTSTTDPNYSGDAILEFFIDKAQDAFIGAISTEIIDETPIGDIDGINSTFSTANKFIADKNYDKSINTADVTVYAWTDSDDLDTRSSVSLSTVNATEGRVKLSTAPASTIERVSIDYRYYLYNIKWEQVDLAVAYLAGYMYFTGKYMEAPLWNRIGAANFRLEDPARRSWGNYLKILNIIRAQQVVKAEMK